MKIFLVGFSIALIVAVTNVTCYDFLTTTYHGICEDISLVQNPFKIVREAMKGY